MKAQQQTKTRSITRLLVPVTFLSGAVFVAVLAFQATATSRTIQCAHEKYDTFGFTPAESDQQLVTQLPTIDQSLRKTYSNFRRWPSESRRTTLQQLLQQRKRSLLRAMTLNGTVATQIAGSLPTDLAKTSTGCLEKLAKYEGILDVTHIDFFQEDFSQNRYVLKSDDGERTLHLGKDIQQNLISGTKVSVRGYELDGQVLSSSQPIDQGQPSTPGVDVVGPATSAVTGNFTTLVARVKFTDSTPAMVTPVTEAIIRNSLFDLTGATVNTGSVNSYYKENSYGAVSFSGSVLSNVGDGWFVLPTTRASDCGFFNIPAQAVSLLDNQVDWRQYQRLVVIIDVDCSWPGVATLGEEIFSTNEGNVALGVSAIRDNEMISMQGPDYVRVHILGHELGHNFGEQHANLWDCPGSTFGPSNCLWREYSDWKDIMGKDFNSAGHFSAPHKEYANWLTSNNIQTVKASGSYSLSPYETDETPGVPGTSGVKALKIFTTPTKYWYLEYRQRTGFDSQIDTYSNGDVYSGLTVHSNYDSNRTTAAEPDLLDASVSSNDPPNDPQKQFTTSLKINQSLTEATTNTAVTVTGLTSSSATVAVTIGPNYDWWPPDVTVVSPPSPSPGETVSNTVTLRAHVTDGQAGVNHVDFGFRRLPDFNTRYFVSMTSPTTGTNLDGYYDASFDTRLAPNGVIELAIFAVDNRGYGQYYYPLSINVLNTSDQTPPTVSITSPVSGTVFPSIRLPTISSTATDNLGIFKLVYQTDGNSLPPFTSYFPQVNNLNMVNLFRPGPLRVRVSAFDFAGNQTDATVDVVRQDPGNGLAPALTVISPQPAEKVTETATFTATASDGDGILWVDFAVDGLPVGRALTSPYTLSWAGAFGSHTVAITAWDLAGWQTATNVPFELVQKGRLTRPPQQYSP